MEQSERKTQPIFIAAFLIFALSASADEGIWFSGPEFCDGICISEPPGADPILLRPGLMRETGDKPRRGKNYKHYIRGFDLSPDGNSIIFVKNSGVYDHLWIMDSDGRNSRELVEGVVESCGSAEPPQFGWGAQWSPDGSWIMFDNGPSRGFGLIRPDGTDRTLISFIAKYDWADHFQWHDGGGIVVSFNLSQPLRIMDVEGDILQEFPEFAPGHRNPQLSPDGSQLSTFLEGWGGAEDSLFVMDLASREVRVIANGHWHTWSPDGQKIAYRHRNSGTIRTVNVDGTNETTLLDVDGSYVANIEWMSDIRIPTSIRSTSWGRVKKEIAIP